ncbi:MAG: hypothetical protein K0S01_3352, partial [Herbinix sp.]|nr:hypothetical protein [Herbinix sp.]
MIKEELICNAIYRLPYNLQYFAEGGDKTEEATTKKLNDARGEGQVARSKELITASGLATFFIVLKLFAGYIGDNFIETFIKDFNNIDKFSREEFNIKIIGSILSDVLISIIVICAPIFATAMLIAFVVNVFQVKWQISLKIIRPKFNKINPINGFKKIISKDKIIDLLIELIKIAVISYVAYSTLKNEWKTLFILYDMKLEQAILLVGNLVINLGLKISMIFIVIGFGDLIYQRLKFKKDMRMTKQEVKDEY